MPIPSTEAAILDEDGAERAVGEIGEIAVRGPQVMTGCWNRPAEARRVFTEDGWLRTGDTGFVDERFQLRITDRKKDMILVSGSRSSRTRSRTGSRCSRPWPRWRPTVPRTSAQARS
jgi:long-chain acyl-CoA synthetase